MKKTFLGCLIIVTVIMLLSSCGLNTPDAPNEGDEQSHIHEFGDWSVLAYVTCTEDGEKVRFCSCGERQTEYIPSHGHPEVIDAAVEPTCTESGLTEGKHCAECGEVIIPQIAVDPIHSFENYVCVICGEKYYSKGLSFTSTGNYTCYVSGIGTCTDTHIIVPPVSPDGDVVTGIGNDAFYTPNDTSPISIELPDYVRNSSYFDGLTLTSITVGENNAYYKSIDGNLYSKDGKILIKYAIGKKDTEFIIPDSVTSIGDRAFSGCTSLTSIVIPDSVTSIGEDAFFDCDSLTSIEIPDSVTSIGEYAFVGCYSLTSVVIGDSVTSIGEAAFRNCSSLTDVYYTGTTEEWLAIDISTYYDYNAYLTNATIHYNYVP